MSAVVVPKFGGVVLTDPVSRYPGQLASASQNSSDAPRENASELEQQVSRRLSILLRLQHAYAGGQGPSIRMERRGGNTGRRGG